MDTIAIASNLAQVVGVLFLGVQVYYMFKDNRRAHRRDQQRETLQAMHDFLRNYKDERLWLLDADNVGKLKDPGTLTPHERQVAEQFLGVVERLAIGVRCDVYDIGIIARTSRRFLITAYESFSPYIEEKRRVCGAGSIFENYQWLRDRLQAERSG